MHGRVAVEEIQAVDQEMIQMKKVVEEVMKGVQMGLVTMERTQMRVIIEIQDME